ncbi:MAG: type IV pili methyl-accepting chemotaxis transducer N-terminal domain-containing protein [Parvularculaceae bacterium]|nr:type IV pili methyl-accepting chemotaxis transducer N-terminal domain-containing protein [Parvularculaceae bacterium]
MSDVNFKPQSLLPRYLMAVGLIVVLVLVSHSIGFLALRGGEEAATAINVSGKQRLLAQRIAHMTSEAHNPAIEPEERALAQERLETTAAQFTQGHQALTSGGSLGLTSEGAERRGEVYLETRDGTALRDHVAQFLVRVDSATRGEAEAVRSITDINNVEAMVAVLDQAVQGLEGQASKSVQRAKFISTLSLIAAILVLCAEALFIFVPAHRAIANSFRKLTQANSALTQSKRDLHTALGDADIARSHIEHLLDEHGQALRKAATDIRSPLATLDSILGELFEEAPLQHRSRELTQASNAVLKMRTTLTDVFEKDQGISALVELDDAPINLQQFLEALESVANMWARRKDISVSIERDERLPAEVIMDCPRMERVLSNLLSNAVKYTERGSITLTAAPAGRGLIRYSVKDTGIGISGDVIERLLRGYPGEDQQLATASTGTGLGLSICRELTELMGGTIRVESVLGEGSTFSVTLPLKTVEPETARGAA